MKRLTLLLMACLLMLPAAYSEGENTILRHAVELGKELDALAENEAYFAPYGLNEGIMNYIRYYGEGEHDRPIQVVGVDLEEYIQLPDEEENIPEAVVRQVLNRAPAQLLHTLPTAYGGDSLTLPSVLRTSEVFAAPGAKGRALWVLQYENAASIAVGWYAENDAVHMQAVFLPEGTMNGELPFTFRVIAAARPVLDEYACSLADELRVLTQTPAYLQILGLSPEVLATAQSFASKEDQPRMSLCALTDDYNETNTPLFQQIGYLGDITLAAAGAVRTQVIFADEEASGAGLYLFLYEEGVPVIVQWYGENSAYHLTASFQPGEMPFGCQSAEDVNAWAESICLPLNFQPLGAMLLP